MILTTTVRISHDLNYFGHEIYAPKTSRLLKYCKTFDSLNDVKSLVNNFFTTNMGNLFQKAGRMGHGSSSSSGGLQYCKILGNFALKELWVIFGLQVTVCPWLLYDNCPKTLEIEFHLFSFPCNIEEIWVCVCVGVGVVVVWREKCVTLVKISGERFWLVYFYLSVRKRKMPIMDKTFHLIRIVKCATTSDR